MNALARNGSWTVAAILGLVAMPFATAVLAMATAEAFFGTKEQMFEMIGGFLLGLLAVVFAALAMGLGPKCGWSSRTVIKAVLAFDLAALPIGWLLIRIAYQFHSHRIEF